MPKKTIDYPERIHIRVSEKLKNDLLKINKNLAIPIREAIEQYLPIKKLLSNPLALPREIQNNTSDIKFSASTSGVFQLIVNGEIHPIEGESLEIMVANIFMFTLNSTPNHESKS